MPQCTRNVGLCAFVNRTLHFEPIKRCLLKAVSHINENIHYHIYQLSTPKWLNQPILWHFVMKTLEGRTQRRWLCWFNSASWMLLKMQNIAPKYKPNSALPCTAVTMEMCCISPSLQRQYFNCKTKQWNFIHFGCYFRSILIFTADNGSNWISDDKEKLFPVTNYAM